MTTHSQVEASRPKGAGCKRSYSEADFVKLRLGLATDPHPRYLIALRATADYYGWTEEFEPWLPKMVATAGKYRIFQDPGRRGDLRNAGGRRHQICRSPQTAGWPAGLTNQFKVASRCGLADLAELAHFTKGDWYWMTSPFGERISRDRWEAMYQGKSS